MKANKDFDCVQMKNEIQAELQKDWEGLSNAEIRSQIRRNLEQSQSPIGKLWHKLEKKSASSNVPEVALQR